MNEIANGKWVEEEWTLKISKDLDCGIEIRRASKEAIVASDMLEMSRESEQIEDQRLNNERIV